MKKPWRCVVLSALSLAAALPAFADQACAAHPYLDAPAPLKELVHRLDDTLAPYPAMAAALAGQAPSLCLDDGLVEEQGYFEPESNRIVLNSRLGQDFQLAILTHEVRHLQQYASGSCPSIAEQSSDYLRTRLALEADAAAIGVYMAWKLREAGDPAPWDSLATWPSHDDLVSRFAEAIASGADEAAATAATFAQWYARKDRLDLYTYAICSNYLDALDREKIIAGTEEMPADFAQALCRMPDGRAYGCSVP